jgi:hypothetical protein
MRESVGVGDQRGVNGERDDAEIHEFGRAES